MSTLGLVSLLVTAAAVFGWLSARVLRVPQTIGSMGLTVSASIGLIALGGVAPGLHGWALRTMSQVDLRTLILHGGLGLLLFAGSFLLDLEALRRQKLTVGMLSVFATLLSTVGVAGLMFWTLPLVGLRANWVECLLFGALISPTDPIAVLEMLGRAGLGREIEAQLAGESLFNDGVGAVLFLATLGAAEGGSVSVGRVALDGLLAACGGLLLGVALAWCASEMMWRVDRYQVEILVTLALALGGYALAEWMKISAPLEAVAAGLAMREFNSRHTHRQISHADLERFWTLVDEVQNALLFVLLGLEVLTIRFVPAGIGVGIAAIVGVVLVRAASVAVVLGTVHTLARRSLRRLRTSLLALSWGGLRGGLSIALALSVPAAHGRAWILPTTYVVVVFSVMVQGGTLGWVVRRWGAREAAVVQA